ncbi:WD40-repeat-containing domain protein [Catenaria anguillulae PL171]|uniref:WD40-repeat-containing domain protein n=1 Tax=Catenaria anguillulae PL171 TaxID=765915 RepID=A0A1Y2H849_9FUNG|nr:WD40-repeat-containing domain protein [Catenaria anguillulae PL171]
MSEPPHALQRSGAGGGGMVAAIGGPAVVGTSGPGGAGGGGGGASVGAAAARAAQLNTLTLQSDAYANKVNTLKDKALYRFEREMNLAQFKELMMVFQKKASRGGKLTVEEFKAEFSKILDKDMSEAQITLMLMRIGIRGNFVSWDAFGNFMLQRAQEQSKQKESEEQETMLFAPASRLLPMGKPQATPHREMICNVMYMPTQQRFVTVSRDATVCFWSEQFKLQRSFPSVINGKNRSESQQQAAQANLLSSTTTKQCWVLAFSYLPDVKKWVFATDTHELSFHDHATLHPQCKLRLPANVLCLHYFREQYVPDDDLASSAAMRDPTALVGSTAALSTSAPSAAAPATAPSSSLPTDQYINNGMLFLGDDQGDLTIITFDPESIFNPNSPTMLAAAKGKVVSIDKRHVQSIVKRKVHNDWVTRVGYFHEFRTVFSVSPDPHESLVAGTLVNGKWKFMSTSVNKGVNAFAVCKFPVALITVGADRKVRLWNPRRITNPQASMRGHQAPILDVQVQQSLGLCVTASSDKVVKVWDIRKAACIQTLTSNVEFLHRPDDMLGFVQLVTSTVRGPGGAGAAAMGGAITGKGPAAGAAAPTVRLFTGSSFVMEYSMMDTHSMGKTVTSHKMPIRQIVYNPVCKMVSSLCDGSVVQVWEVQNGSLTFKIDDAMEPREITCIGFDEYSGYRRMLIGTGDGKVHLSSIEGHVLCEMRKRDKVEITNVLHVDSNEGRFFVAGGWQCRLYLYTDDSRSEATSMWPTETWSNSGDSGELADGRNDDILSMVFIKPHFLAYSTFRGDIWIRTMAGLQVGSLVPPEINSIPLWSRPVEKLLSLRPVPTHKHYTDPLDASNTADPSSSGRGSTLDHAHLISCGSDGTVRFWNVSKMVQVYTLDVPGATAIGLSPGPVHDALLVGTAQGTLYVYVLTAGEYPSVQARWTAHTRSITCIDTFFASGSSTASNDGWFVVTGGTDGNVRCWSNTGEYVGTFGGLNPWDLGNRATWRHPDKPRDVLEMLRSADARAAAANGGASKMDEQSKKKRGLVGDDEDEDVFDDEKEGDQDGIKLVLSRPSTRSGRMQREIGQDAAAATEEEGTSVKDASKSNLTSSSRPATRAKSSSPASADETKKKPPLKSAMASGRRPATRNGVRLSAHSSQSPINTGSRDSIAGTGTGRKTPSTSASRRHLALKRVTTADLMQKDYRSWFAKSKYAQSHAFSLAARARKGREAALAARSPSYQSLNTAGAAALRAAAAGGGISLGGSVSAPVTSHGTGMVTGAGGADNAFHSLPDYSLDSTALPPLPGGHLATARAVQAMAGTSSGLGANGGGGGMAGAYMGKSRGRGYVNPGAGTGGGGAAGGPLGLGASSTYRVKVGSPPTTATPAPAAQGKGGVGLSLPGLNGGVVGGRRR